MTTPGVDLRGVDDVLNCDQLVEYLEHNCDTDVFWLDTIGRSGLSALVTAAARGVRLRRLRVVRSTVIGPILWKDDVVPESCALAAGTEIRTASSSYLEGHLTNDDFLVLDDRTAVRLVFDDHNRFVFAAHAGPALLNRYRFIGDMWWPTATRT